MEEEGKDSTNKWSSTWYKKTILPVVVYFIFDWQDLVSERGPRSRAWFIAKPVVPPKTHTDSPNDQNQQ